MSLESVRTFQTISTTPNIVIIWEDEVQNAMSIDCVSGTLEKTNEANETDKITMLENAGAAHH